VSRTKERLARIPPPGLKPSGFLRQRCEATVKLPAPDGVFELLRTLIGRIPLYRLECLLATEAEQREWQPLSKWGEAVTLPLARMQPGWYYRVVDQAGTMPPVYLIPHSGGKILLGRLPGGPDPDLRRLPTRPAPPPADLTHDQS